jgi:hypothetical protein
MDIKAKPVKITFTLEQLQEAMEDQSGFCIVCGEYRDCCEPDARNYPCDNCGLHKVYGAEELVLMGYGT